MSVQIEEISSLGSLEAARAEWSALLARCPDAPPFLAPEWLLPWWRHLGGGRLLVLAAREQGCLVALAPLFVHDDAGTRRLAFLGAH